jgi:hypothetical protein
MRKNLGDRSGDILKDINRDVPLFLGTNAQTGRIEQVYENSIGNSIPFELSSKVQGL